METNIDDYITLIARLKTQGKDEYLDKAIDYAIKSLKVARDVSERRDYLLHKSNPTEEDKKEYEFLSALKYDEELF